MYLNKMVGKMKKIVCFLLVMQNVFLLAQTKTVVTQWGEKITIHPNANNGLTPNNGNIQMGGTLTEPATVITTSLANTLAIKGLQTGLSTDHIVVTDPTGVIKTISTDAFWQIQGNAGTTAGTNFLGTTDNVDLVFKRNGLQSGRIGATNASFGVNSLLDLSATNAVAVGTDALKNATGKWSVGVGCQVLMNATGTGNTAVGDAASNANTTGTNNVAVGKNALGKNISGGQNVAVGVDALANITTVYSSTAVGYGALTGYNGTNGLNTAFGYYSLLKLTSGGSNVAVGPNAASNVKAATNSVFIGESCAPQGEGQTNQIVIGRQAIGRGSNTVTIGDNTMTSIGGQVAWSNPSDVRLKKDINDSPFGLNFINKLRPVTYHMKTGTKDLQTGFIAQEVEKVANSLSYDFNGIVKPKTDSDTDFYSLRYSDFVVPLVKAVQEQQLQIESQQAKLSANELEMKEMKERLQKLEKLVNIRINSN